MSKTIIEYIYEEDNYVKIIHNSKYGSILNVEVDGEPIGLISFYEIEMFIRNRRNKSNG